MKRDDRQGGQRTEVLRARCEPELKARVVKHAARRGHDEADIVRQAVLELLERIERGQEVAA
jgi:hypothetical protein